VKIITGKQSGNFFVQIAVYDIICLLNFEQIFFGRSSFSLLSNNQADAFAWYFSLVVSK
jgi:hypothetical protein